MSKYSICLGLALATLSVTTAASAQDESWEGTPQEAFLNSEIVRKFQCVTCHTVTDQGGTVGPILNMVGLRRSKDWLHRWLNEPNDIKPGTKMPKFPFEEGELEATAEYLSKMNRELRTGEILASDRSSVEKGQALFRDYDCDACHRLGDEGRFVGPDLTWVGIRKPEEWERIWLHDPPAFKPDTFMPNFGIPEKGVEHLAAYLHTLQGEQNDAGRQWEYRISFTITTNDVFRGDMVWKRLGCWGCHGEGGKGGIENPNAAAGHEMVPDIRGIRDKYDKSAFLAKITSGTQVAAKDPSKIPLPYNCPVYSKEALNQQGLDDLYAYVSSLAPPRSDWQVQGAAPATEIAAGDYEEIEVEGGGTVTGRVYFEDEMPERERIRPSRDLDTCGIRIAGETFVVDRDSGGLANAVVRIEGIAKGKAFAAAEETLTQLECRYNPRVTVVRPDQQITITNADPVLHNVHAYRGDDTVFNMAQPFKGMRSPQSLPKEGLVRVACDVHDWMEAWVFVLNNPYVATSDEEGGFSIGDVPPGTYKVTLWHERLGTATKEVTVEAGGTSEIDFTIVGGGS